MGVRAYAVGDIREEIKYTPVAASFGNACISRWVPPTEDDTDHKGLEEFHDVDGLMLHHHLVGHAASNNDGEQCSQCHTHL